MGEHANIIKEKLQDLASQTNIRILLACESGSRAWGFPSQDSDYDVRFIYTNQPHWYLSINQARDVLESLGELYDFSGWDLKKALNLTRNGNCALSEWYGSPIIYWQHPESSVLMHQFIQQCFLPRSACYHYLAMSTNKFKQLQDDAYLNAKTYFYALRTALCAVYISRKRSIPPITLHELIDELMASHPLVQAVNDLVKTKEQGNEASQLKKDPQLINLIAELITEVEANLPDKKEKMAYSECNHLFHKLLAQSWKINQIELT